MSFQNAQSRQFSKPTSNKSDFVTIQAKALSTAFYDALSAIASSDGFSRGWVELENGNQRRTRFDGVLNGVKANHAKTVKDTISQLIHGIDIAKSQAEDFKKAAKSLDGTKLFFEEVMDDRTTVIHSFEYKLKGLSGAVTSLLTAVELQRGFKPQEALETHHSGQYPRKQANHQSRIRHPALL